MFLYVSFKVFFGFYLMSQSTSAVQGSAELCFAEKL